MVQYMEKSHFWENNALTAYSTSYMDANKASLLKIIEDTK